MQKRSVSFGVEALFDGAPMADGHVFDWMPTGRRWIERYMDRLDVTRGRSKCGMGANCHPIVLGTADEQLVAVRPCQNRKVARGKQRTKQYVREIASEMRTPEDDKEEDLRHGNAQVEYLVDVLSNAPDSPSLCVKAW